jgi:amidase
MELAALDATAQANLVRAGDVMPRELVNAAIERIERVDPSLNAIVLERFDRALADAASIPDDAPFPGVPFVTKDLNCHTAGEPATEGSRAFKDAGWCAPATDELARRFRAAGLVNLGRSNAPELGLQATTEPLAWGPTRNPWDVARSPGGSSGGSAAAVAAGLVPFGHGSDGGGSIRGPASACGLVGLKVSRGRTPIGPALGELTNFLSVQFGLTRSVRDAAALLDAVHGRGPGDLYTAPGPDRPFLGALTQPLTALRIGLLAARPVDGGAVDPECRAAAEGAARLLVALGHDVEVCHPPALDDQSGLAATMVTWTVTAAHEVRAAGHALGREIPDEELEPLTRELVAIGRTATAVDYLDALDEMQRWARRLRSWWDDPDGPGFDLLVTPTLAEPPLPLGELSVATQGSVEGVFLRSARFTPFLAGFNLTGQPALSLPLHATPDGLPVGVQLVAGYGREDLLLSVGAALEAAAPWASRRPAVHA